MPSPATKKSKTEGTCSRLSTGARTAKISKKYNQRGILPSKSPGRGPRLGAPPLPYTLQSVIPPYRVGAGLAPISANLRMAVILSAAKDLRTAHREILRCAQDDRWWAGRPHGRSLTHLNSDTFRLKFAPLGLAPALVIKLRCRCGRPIAGAGRGS